MVQWLGLSACTAEGPNSVGWETKILQAPRQRGKKDMCICITESLFYVSEISTTLLTTCAPI